MKIDGSNVKGTTGTQRTGVSRETGVSKGTARSSQTGTKIDQVSVSARARAASTLKARIQEAPEVRMDLVEKLKAQIESGAYSVEPLKVADKMLRSRVLDE